MIRTRNLPFAATVLIFVVAYALCVLQFPNMLSFRVIGNLLTDNAFLGIAAVGMTFVILSGGIDLSMGSVIAFTSVFVAVLVRAGVHPALAFALALAVSTSFGALMGLTIHALKMPAFVVTLAGMFLARGAAFLISTDSVPISHDFLKQINQIKKMGNMKDLMGMIPGVGKAIKDVDINDDAFKHIEAIIHSMTPDERRRPSIINVSRKQRIAKGAGRKLEEVNALMKQFDQMGKMMKMMQGPQGKQMMQMMSKMPNMPGMGGGLFGR